MAAANLVHKLSIKQRTFIGLLLASWLMLFVSAPAHALSHYDEVGFTHCSLCAHHHQMQACLPQSFVPPAVSPQVCPHTVTATPSLWRQHTSHFQSRAPPSLN